MYRVSGSGPGCRSKPVPTGGSWAGRGPPVESETTESFLAQPAARPASGFRYARSPVCRLLEQTQYVATPTEDQHRPRPSGPPAFASPAYFLPALSWLRLPVLRQAWPGDGNGSARGGPAYHAARPVQCDCGETTHHWASVNDGGQWAESRPDEPEYSEIWEGPERYSSLSPGHVPSSNGFSPYEYEMQERASRPNGCECNGDSLNHSQRPQAGPAARSGNEHRYEKLWQCNEGEEAALGPQDHESDPAGTCRSGWLSKYRLPSPCVTASDPTHRKQYRFGHAQHCEGGAGTDDLTSDTELLPCECAAGRSLTAVPSDSDFVSTDHSRGVNGRAEVNYTNPMFESRSGRETMPHHGSSPLLSRLWGYMGWNRR